jgi:hypothetical protein
MSNYLCWKDVFLHFVFYDLAHTLTKAFYPSTNYRIIYISKMYYNISFLLRKNCTHSCTKWWRNMHYVSTRTLKALWNWFLYMKPKLPADIPKKTSLQNMVIYLIITDIHVQNLSPPKYFYFAFFLAWRIWTV